MNKIYVDINKEKCDFCYCSDLEIVREEECSNDVKVLKKVFRSALKTFEATKY